MEFISFVPASQSKLFCWLLIVCIKLISSCPALGQSVQNIVPVQEVAISTEDLGGVEWKVAQDILGLISVEQSRVVQTMGFPDFDVNKLPTFRGYERVLLYLQADVADYHPISESLEKSYQRVTAEVFTDASLIGADLNTIAALITDFAVILRK
jgi:hypothetical protein